jgi:ubiquinone/menaquinone biosynthesis C-methylase UbiE
MKEGDSKRTREEFTRQAKQMAAAPAFHAEPVLKHFAEAVGEAPAGRVLDVACGPGIVAEVLAPYAREIVGIDATPEMIRLAGERFTNAGLSNGRFQVALAEHLPFQEESFDQVVTRLSFHHLQDVPAVLHEIHRVLRPGGQLVAADILSVEEAGKARLHNSLEQLRDPSHVRFFARDELLRLVEAAGFSLRHEQSWEQVRSFGEWAAIVADPARTAPLENVMRALAQAGQDCGISLREEAGSLLFTHTWLMFVAESS